MGYSRGRVGSRAFVVEADACYRLFFSCVLTDAVRYSLDGRVRVGLSLIDVGLFPACLAVCVLVYSCLSLLSELGVGVSVDGSADASVAGWWDGMGCAALFLLESCGLEKRSKEKEQNYCCVARRRRKKKREKKSMCTKYDKRKKRG